MVKAPKLKSKRYLIEKPKNQYKKIYNELEKDGIRMTTSSLEWVRKKGTLNTLHHVSIPKHLNNVGFLGDIMEDVKKRNDWKER